MGNMSFEEISMETFGRMLKSEIKYGTEMIDVRINDTSNLVLNTWYTIHDPDVLVHDETIRISSEAYDEDDTLILPMDKVSHIYRRKIYGGREIMFKYPLDNTEIIYVLTYECFVDDEDEEK